jgi:hypothetical protein
VLRRCALGQVGRGNPRFKGRRRFCSPRRGFRPIVEEPYVLAGDGNLAWVEYERLHVCLATGAVAIGATGVKARSVTLEGGRLTWTDLDGEHAFGL